MDKISLHPPMVDKYQPSYKIICHTLGTPRTKNLGVPHDFFFFFNVYRQAQNKFCSKKGSREKVLCKMAWSSALWLENLWIKYWHAFIEMAKK